MNLTSKITALLPIGIFHADITGRVLYANQRWYDIAHITLSNTPLFWSQTIHPDDRYQVEQEWLTCLKNRQAFASEFRYQHANQREVWVSCQIVLEYDIDEQAIGFIGTISDITDRVKKNKVLLKLHLDLEQRVEERTADLRAKNRWLQQVVREREQAQIALIEEKNYISAILDTAGALVLVCDPDGVILSFNHSCQKRSCFSAEEIKGKLLWEAFIPKEDQDIMKGVIQKLASNDEPVKLISKWIKNQEQHCIISWTNTALRNANDKLTHIIFTGIDITEQRIAQQAAQQHQAELVHVSRLSTMGEMATGMAHELNQPLTAIVNYAQGSIRRLSAVHYKTNDIIQALNEVTSQAQRAGNIIRRLRRFVHKDEFQRNAIDLRKLIADAVSMASIEIEKHSIQINYQHALSMLVVKVDTIQIEQVVVNLIINAIDAMNNNAKDDRELNIKIFTNENNYAHISVKDNGEGLSTECDANKLFDTFFTTKKKGMGMGLAICRSIIEAHEGKIWATKNQDRGATFHFTLPLSTS